MSICSIWIATSRAVGFGNLPGAIVRTLPVGHKPAAAYESKDKAIYWDGRNNLGERVASGIYFYTLTANDFTATRKMLIMK